MTLWSERDLPILKAMAAVEESGEYTVTVASIAASVGREDQDTWIGLRSLRTAAYVDWTQEVRTIDGTRRLTEPRLAERGRRLLGQWPQDEYQSLLTIIEERIEATADPDERSRLVRFRDGLIGVGRDVATDILAAILKDQAGIR
jgi:hypothetical protein